MQDKFPTGLAKSAPAANAVVASGGLRPKVSPRTYKANKDLDRDKDGSVCEIQPETSEFTTSFGIISVQSVAPPTTDTCVNVPVSMDIRNMMAINGTTAYSRVLGMTVKLVSQFGNVIGYEEFEPISTLTPAVEMKPAGVYPINLQVCQQVHESTSRPSQKIAGFKADESYSLEFAMWLGEDTLASNPYAFLK
ncbi:MAG: hypothetical protein F2763_06840 [Actinobacteria bacterium]|nr:hypothetical protein [Actinomycetota bacterium]